MNNILRGYKWVYNFDHIPNWNIYLTSKVPEYSLVRDVYLEDCELTIPHNWYLIKDPMKDGYIVALYNNQMLMNICTYEVIDASNITLLGQVININD